MGRSNHHESPVAACRHGEMLIRNAKHVVVRVLPVALCLALGAAGCGEGTESDQVDFLTAGPRVSARFVSFAVDMDQLAGGTFWDPTGGPTVVDVPPYDFARPRLRALVRALAPAYLRLGGSASDRTYYDLSDTPATEPPAPFELVLTRAQWDAAAAFATDLGLEIVFTVNAGPGPRDAALRWTETNARALLVYATAQRHPLAALEFGNEPNLFAIRAGISGYTATDYARDLATFRALRDAVAPGTPVFGPGNIYTRTQGEDIVPGIVFGPRATETVPLVGSTLDGLNYHYYAAISTRCPLGPRVTIDTALDPAYLDGIDEAAGAIDALRDQYAPGRPIWLTETGGQSCGGQIGVGDRFVNTFWFLNTLGRLARRGHAMVARQTLSGSTYGLIDELSLEPRPDYWAALLWRRLMGAQVLQLPPLGIGDHARVYAHCERDGPAGAVVILVLNPSRTEAVDLTLAEFGLAPPVQLYVGSANDLGSTETLLNGAPLANATDGSPPPFSPIDHGAAVVTVSPASWAFIVAPNARVDACSSSVGKGTFGRNGRFFGRRTFQTVTSRSFFAPTSLWPATGDTSREIATATLACISHRVS